jgi:hypothetical protein
MNYNRIDEIRATAKAWAELVARAAALGDKAAELGLCPKWFNNPHYEGLEINNNTASITLINYSQNGNDTHEFDVDLEDFAADDYMARFEATHASRVAKIKAEEKRLADQIAATAAARRRQQFEELRKEFGDK